jgi:dTDP-glucose pyrophosphorylase
MRKLNAEGGILTFKSDNPKWSYASCNYDNLVKEVAEKDPISEHATVGIYYFKHGKDFVKYAKQMIDKDITTNDEFYVCPVFNEMIQGGKLVHIYPIENSIMHGLGTPEDLETFIAYEDLL